MVGSVVTQCAHNDISLLTEEPHGKVSVHACTLRFYHTGCQVTIIPILKIFKIVGVHSWLTSYRGSWLAN